MSVDSVFLFPQEEVYCRVHLTLAPGECMSWKVYVEMCTAHSPELTGLTRWPGLTRAKGRGDHNSVLSELPDAG